MSPNSDEPPDDVSYEPRSVKAIFAEMKDTAELLIDLAYSAVLYRSDDIAQEVLLLEEQMDRLQLQARMSLLMAARSPTDAEQLAPVLGIVAAAEKVSNAAGDIAKVGLEERGLPAEMRAAFANATETVAQATVSTESSHANQTLGGLNFETETGVRIVSIRRGEQWITHPNRETRLEPNDVVLLRGPEDGIRTVFGVLSDNDYSAPPATEGTVDDLDRAIKTIVLMKDMSELAIDLAYGAVLYDSQRVAEEVHELEVELDSLQSRLEAWTLRAASRVDDPVSLRGLIHVASAVEEISDAALEISEGVLRGLPPHPIIAEAVGESDEVIIRFTIRPDSDLDDATIGKLNIRTETGMHILAIRRPATQDEDQGEWIVSPGPTTHFTQGDVVLAKGTRAGASRLGQLAGVPREFS